jgi:hypothetical protein
MLKVFRKNTFLILILFLTFLLRFPSLFEPYWYGDEGVYLTLGLGLRKGLFLYKDIFDNKPPLIYLLAAVAGNLFWFRFLLLVFCLGSIILLAKIAKIFFPKNDSSCKVVIFTFSILSSIPLIEGNITNAEILQILPLLGAIYLLVRKKLFQKPPNINYLLAGILFGIAVLFKVPAVFDFLAFLLFLVFYLTPKKIFKFYPQLIFLAGGFLLPILLTFTYFLCHHYLKEFIQITFFQNLGYLSSWQTGSHQISLLKSGLFQKSLFLSLILLLIFSQSKKFSSKWSLFTQIWFLFSLFAATLSGRPYAHYLIQILPPFCLLLGDFIANTNFARWSTFLLMILLSAQIAKTRYWVYPVFSYYQNFFKFVLKTKSLEEYFSFFDKKVPQTYEISSYLATHTRPTDKIFIWADEPYIFALSGRLPSGRFTVAYHIIDFDKFAETEEALRKNWPQIIVFDLSKKGIFPGLESIISAKYYLTRKIGNFEIYRLMK